MKITLALLLCLSVTLANPTPGFIVSEVFNGQITCTGSSPVIIVATSTACSASNGSPYGYVTFNSTTITYFDCTNSACSSCTERDTVPYGCSFIQGTFPQGFLTTASSTFTIPSGYSGEYFYSQTGCDDASLTTIVAYDQVCIQIPHSATAYADLCNATTFTQYSGCTSYQCDETSCSSVTYSPVGTCINNGGQSVKYVCNVGTECQGTWECASLGTSYGFAVCENGYCQCSESFEGSATPSDQCSCSNGQVAYDYTGTPYCVPEGSCQAGNDELPYLCASYTDNWNYIDCVNGQCQCLPGFQGDATSSSKCTCDGNVNWTSSGPVCQ